MYSFITRIAAVLLTFALPFAGQGQTVIVDNRDAGFAVELGTWQTGSSTPNGYSTDYRFAETTAGGTPTARCRFTPNLPLTGYYYIGVWYNVGTNRASNAPYTVHGDLVTSTVLVDQQLNGGQFFYIGQAHFQAGSGGSVSLANNASNLVVMADAVQWVYAGTSPGPEPGVEPGPEPNNTPEVRGLWVSRFEWPQSSESATKARLDQIINTMDNANFNALFLQVRGAMETFYPSPNEPWARETYNRVNPGYDPMAYAIQQSHARNIEFHAYINTHVITQSAATFPPSPSLVPPHPFNLHGNPADPNHSDWVFHIIETGTGNYIPQPLTGAQAGEENYNWTAPGVPGFMKWTRDQVLYVAQNYNVDGVHFDRIRFAGQGSYDPISLARSAVGSPSNPTNLSFRSWNRDQITRLVNDIYGAVAEVNYNRPSGKRLVQVSSAPFRGKSQQESVNQMLGEWCGIGAQDFFVPQVYTSSVSTFESVLQTNFPLAADRFVVAGLSRGTAGSGSVIVDEIASARELGAKGSVIFSYSSIGSSEFTQIKNLLYTEKVATPDMPWLSSPTQGIVVGNVTGPGGVPILDAQVKRTGSTYTWLSGQDGFYSMLKIPASQAITVTVTKAGYPAKVVNVPALTAGEVRRVNIALGDSAVDDWHIY